MTANDAIVPLPESDLAALQALLQDNDLPADDCADLLDCFFAIYQGDRLVATGGLEPAGNYALLRSVAVPADYRSRGLGRRMTDYLLALAAERQLGAVFLLTESADDYFDRLGFERVPRDRVPAEIAATEQFSRLCPDSAICMRFDLQTSPGAPIKPHA